jgi:hypothetical protein
MGTQSIIHGSNAASFPLRDTPSPGRASDVGVEQGVVGKEGGEEAVLEDLTEDPLGPQGIPLLGVQVEEEVKGGQGGGGGRGRHQMDDRPGRHVVVGQNTGPEHLQVRLFLDEEGGTEGFLSGEKLGEKALDVGGGHDVGMGQGRGRGGETWRGGGLGGGCVQRGTKETTPGAERTERRLGVRRQWQWWKEGRKGWRGGGGD